MKSFKITPAFAILTPTNALAKLAFHDVVSERYLRQDQMDEDHRFAYTKQFIHIDEEQQFQADVQHWQAYDSGIQPIDSDRGSSTEPDTQTGEELACAATIWSGFYTFRFEKEDQILWSAGLGKTPLDTEFVLASLSSNSVSHIRRRHARFMFNLENGLLGVMRASRAATNILVDGNNVREKSFALNRNTAQLQIGPFEYRFEYTDYSRTEDFANLKLEALRSTVYNIDPANVTPTPLKSSVVIDSWTQSTSVGYGTFGTVYRATNSSQEVVAIKQQIRKNKFTAAQIEREIQTHRSLNQLTENETNKSRRLLFLRHVVYASGEAEWQSPRPELVYLVLEPFCPRTLQDALDIRVTDLFPLEKRIRLFHDTLKAVNLIHQHNWLHNDVKPANIGIRCISPAGVTLLDIGGAKELDSPHANVSPAPGQSGTIGYLAPEKEMQPYGLPADVWALGVVGYQLLTRTNPWVFAQNPWRPGQPYEDWRELFHKRHCAALDQLKAETNEPLFADLLSRMLCHDYEHRNRGPRIALAAALQHKCWDGR